MTRRTLVLAGAALLLAALSAAAQDLTLAIVGGTVHPISGPPIENATVLVRGHRIEAVGPGIEIPAGATRIDAAGKIVTPGLFDPSSTIGLVEVDLVSQTRDESATSSEDPVAAAFDPLDGLNPNSVLIPYLRTYGLTTTVTRPTGGLVSGMGAVIDLSGEAGTGMVARPRAAMFASFDEGAFRQVGGARGATALRLRELLDDARFWARNRAAFDRGESRDLAASRLDLEALQPVLAGTMPLVVEVDRASDIRAVLRIADEYGIRPVILGGAEAWVVADELAAGSVPVLVKPLTSLPSAFERLGARFDNATLLHAAGVPIAIGVFDTHRSHAITQEAGNAVRFGLPWDAALRAITLAPAEIYGVADRYGSIEPGKMANLVVWSGDPLEVSSRAETVMIRGSIVPMTSRIHQLFDRYRSLDDTARPSFDVPE